MAGSQTTSQKQVAKTDKSERITGTAKTLTKKSEEKSKPKTLSSGAGNPPTKPPKKGPTSGDRDNPRKPGEQFGKHVGKGATDASKKDPHGEPNPGAKDKGTRAPYIVKTKKNEEAHESKSMTKTSLKLNKKK